MRVLASLLFLFQVSPPGGQGHGLVRLQDAIDAAQSGAVIDAHLYAPVKARILVEKGLTIVGAYMPEGCTVLAPAQVTLSACALELGTPVSPWSPTIDGVCQRLVLDGCVVEGAPAIAQLGNELVLLDSDVRSGPVAWAPSSCQINVLAYPGVELSYGRVVARRSRIQGGDGPATAYAGGSCDGWGGCVEPGGPAVRAQVLIEHRSRLTGGRGAHWTNMGCFGPDGAPFEMLPGTMGWQR